MSIVLLNLDRARDMVPRNGQEKGSACGRLGPERRESPPSKYDAGTAPRNSTESRNCPVGEGKSEKASVRIDVVIQVRFALPGPYPKAIRNRTADFLAPSRRPNTR